MFYFKKIVSYFDYYEYGEKKKSCGYAKIIVKDHDMTLEVRLKGLPIKGAGTYELTTLGGQKRRLGQFSVEHGTGCFYACFHTMDLDGSGLSAFAVSGLSVQIDDERSCGTTWNWGLLPDLRLFESRSFEGRSVQGHPAETNAAASAGSFSEENAEGKTAEQGAEKIQTMHAEQEIRKTPVGQEGQAEPERQEGQRALARQEGQVESVGKEEQAASAEQGGQRQEASAEIQAEASEPRLFHKPVSESGYLENGEEIPQQEILHEDKWQQLRALYPVCHPFGEHEDYIVIAPKDFIVLRREYQNLVSNSFLLHSFYNYHHVILGKMGSDGSGNYYIGVPGNYFEREKKVAVMFGFEGFAQSARKNDSSVTRKSEQTQIETGAFGYYMKQVEI